MTSADSCIARANFRSFQKGKLLCGDATSRGIAEPRVRQNRYQGRTGPTSMAVYPNATRLPLPARNC